MQLKPLLLIIPCFLILALLLLVDSPLPETADVSASDGSAREEKKDSSTAAVSVKKVDRSVSGSEKKEQISMTLVVGQTGDLKQGGEEPIYQDPDLDSEVIAKLQYNCTVIQLEDGTDDEWIHVDLKDKGSGYVLQENVKVMPVTITAEDPVRMKIIKDSLSYLGLKFVRYGKSLEDGIDCSNFIQQIYRMNGLDISDEPKEQRDQGLVIPVQEAKPGDIIFYDKANNGYGHVAIFLGSGFVINASGHSGTNYPEGGVRIVSTRYDDRTHFEVVSYLQPAPNTDLDQQLKEAQDQSGASSGQTSSAAGKGDNDGR